MFSYASRNALCEHAYQATRKDLLKRREDLEPLLAGHGMQLNLERLQQEDRTLMGSITHELSGHSRVSRNLATTLDDLEEMLHAAR